MQKQSFTAFSKYWAKYLRQSLFLIKLQALSSVFTHQLRLTVFGEARQILPQSVVFHKNIQHAAERKIYVAIFFRGLFLSKRLCQSLLFHKAAGLRPTTLLKKRYRHRCFLMNFAKFYNTLFYETPLMAAFVEGATKTVFILFCTNYNIAIFSKPIVFPGYLSSELITYKLW